MTKTLTKKESLKISEKFHLSCHLIESGREVKTVTIGRLIHMIIDCSGSMYGHINQIKRHVKNMVVTKLKPGDKFYLGYFSSSGMFGFLLEDFEVNDLTDINAVHNTIDKLDAMSLTCFNQILELSETKFKEKIEKNKLSHADYANVLFFLSDGHHNTGGSEKDILAVCERLAPIVNSAVVVPYGWYANEDLLRRMASSLGGSFIFAENFPKYEPVIEQVINSTVTSGSKIQVELPSIPIYGLVWTVKDKEIILYDIEVQGQDDKTINVHVNPDVKELYYFTPKGNENLDPHSYGIEQVRPLYTGMGLLAQRMKSSEVWEILKALGDIELINKYNNSFGKQNISEFAERCFEVGLDKDRVKGTPYKDGKNFNLVPPDNAYCILDLMNDLLSGDNYFYPDHESWNYNRIGAKAVQTATMLNEDEQEQLDELTAQLSSAKDSATITSINNEIQKLINQKKPLSFTKSQNMKPYPLEKLVWNKSRANLSIQVCYEGTVNLPERNTKLENSFDLPDDFPTVQFRNYTIIKDGIVNLKEIPVSVDFKTYSILVANGLISNKHAYLGDNQQIYVLDLTKLNAINRSMVKDISGKDTFELAIAQLRLQAEQKVFKYLEESNFPKEKSKGIADKYGQEAAEWLKTECGITDGGFAPKSKLVKSGDVYPAVELNFKIPTSTLPAVEKVIEKITKYNQQVTDGIEEAKRVNFNLAEQMMKESYDNYIKFISSEVYLKASDMKAMLKTWLETETKAAIIATRQNNNELSKIKFSVILSQRWFREFKSPEENELTIDCKYGKIPVTADMRTIEVEL